MVTFILLRLFIRWFSRFKGLFHPNFASSKVYKPSNIKSMKTSKKVLVALGVVLIVACAKNGHINLPGHGNREYRNLVESVENYVSSRLHNGETVEFGSKYNCEDYIEKDEVRFSANIVFYVISEDGTPEKHIAHVVCNEDKDRIIEWKDII